MTVEEDAKRERATGEGERAPDDAAEATSEASAEARPAPDALAERPSDAPATEGEEHEEHDVSPVAPTQMGEKRFVYAAYFGGAIGIAFIASKALDLAWQKAQNYKPSIGDPHDEVLMPIAALIGGGIALYCWYRTNVRRLTEEVAAEMSKVTWPDRAEVTNGTVVVIITTIVSTVFFALMDKFWGFITNLVYGGT